MKKMRVVSITCAVVFLSLNSAYAQMPQCEGKESLEKPGRRILQQLNLTEQQQKKLEENQVAQRQKMKESISEMKEAQAKLQEAIKEPKSTRAGVEPIIKEIKKLQAEMIDNRTDGIFAVKKILTPEQFAKFQQTIEKRKEGMKERFRNWWRRRGK
ncbi:MAG: Spy/CpxP family protein refolding chaperone [Candidatus Omnitrophica bacterium]|nr:Spy/CpxP family protein refolding chaperone [Candidatus Omnitrophota bacterium]